MGGCGGRVAAAPGHRSSHGCVHVGAGAGPKRSPSALGLAADLSLKVTRALCPPWRTPRTLILANMMLRPADSLCMHHFTPLGKTARHAAPRPARVPPHLTGDIPEPGENLRRPSRASPSPSNPGLDCVRGRLRSRCEGSGKGPLPASLGVLEGGPIGSMLSKIQ